MHTPIWCHELSPALPLLPPPPAADMVCNLTLVDPSTHETPGLAAGVEMLCFAQSAAQLPQLRRPGDIVRLHRVKVGAGAGGGGLAGVWQGGAWGRQGVSCG